MSGQYLLKRAQQNLFFAFYRTATNQDWSGTGFLQSRTQFADDRKLRRWRDIEFQVSAQDDFFFWRADFNQTTQIFCRLRHEEIYGQQKPAQEDPPAPVTGK